MIRSDSHKPAQSLLLLALVIAGFGFRVWIFSAVPQPFILDQEEYETYALRMYNNNLIAAHSYRPYPFPLFLAALYRLSYFGNHTLVYYVHAFLDSIVSALIFYILFWSFGQKRIAWIGSLGYAFNFVTSGYTGTVLSEILSGFLLCFSLFLGLHTLKKPSLLRGVIWGICLGLAAQTRLAAFLWILIPLTASAFIFRKTLGGFVKAAVLAGVLSTMIYPLWVNWKYYHEITVSTVDNFYAKEVFLGALVKKQPPFTGYPPEANIMYGEYYTELHPERNTKERRDISRKYYAKAWDIIRSDPGGYVLSGLHKMGYMWQKENMYYYYDPAFKAGIYSLYVSNLFVLCLCVLGILRSFFLKKNRMGIWFIAVTAGTLVYTTLALSITHAEYRLTVPFYSYVFLFAAVGLDWGIYEGKKLTRYLFARGA